MELRELEALIYEYHWRKRELDRLTVRLFGHYSTFTPNKLVATYGVEATLPQPNTSMISYAEMDALDAREQRMYKRWQDYQEKVDTIENLANHLKDEQQLIILDCMMEGMSYRSIADHLGLSRTKVGELKNEMLDTLSQKCQFCHA